MKEKGTPQGVDAQELEAITREIHAQLREVYGVAPEADARRSKLLQPGSAGDAARFAAVFLLPPLAMVGLGFVLKLAKDGF